MRWRERRVAEGAGDDLRIDGYADLVPIDAGASFSTVHRATYLRSNRTVVVKLLALDLRGEEARERFMRETEATGPLADHPNVVHVVDAGFTDRRRPYITSEYMERGSVGEQLDRDGPLPVHDTLRIGVKIAGAVASMHAIGLVHRNIKPRNILLSGFGEPGLADFGIATVLTNRVATTGTFSSTPVYAAPEVLDGQPANAATDVWSLAATLYTMLAGRAPFAGPPREGMYALIRRILDEPVPPIERDDVPAVVADALAHAMAKRPADRYATALDLGRALQAAQRVNGLAVTEMLAPLSEPIIEVVTNPRTGRRQSRPTMVLSVSGLAELAQAGGTVPPAGTAPVPRAVPPFPSPSPAANDQAP